MTTKRRNLMHTRTTPMIGALVFVTIVAAGATSAQAAVTTLGLWRLGEDDAGAVAGNTGNAGTTAAVGFDSVRGGDPTYSSNTPGPGSALSMAFDGTGDVYSIGEPVTTLIDKWGIEAWVSVTTLDTGGEDRIIAFNGDPASNGWGLIQNGGVLFGRLPSLGFTGSVITEVDRWYHVAFVRDGNATFYFNGVAATITIGDTPNAPTDPFLIGGNGVAGTGYFEGNIDHVRVFSFVDSTFDPQTDLSLGIPEPSTLILAAMGLIGLAAFGWRRRKR